MKRTAFTCAIVLAVFVAGSTIAQAADFTFTVPVDVSNLPSEITYIKVCCYAAANTALVGSGHSCAGRRSVSGGAYRGTFTVEYNARPGVDPATADRYTCYVAFEAMVSGRSVEVAGYTMGSLPLPLSSGSLKVQGTISH